MAKTNVEHPLPNGNPLLLVPAVLLAELIGEAGELGTRLPEICASSQPDQDCVAMVNKQLRCKQQAWQARWTAALPSLESVVAEPVKATGLRDGRPRMPPRRASDSPGDLALLSFSVLAGSCRAFSPLDERARIPRRARPADAGAAPHWRQRDPRPRGDAATDPALSVAVGACQGSGPVPKDLRRQKILRGEHAAPNRFGPDPLAPGAGPPQRAASRSIVK